MFGWITILSDKHIQWSPRNASVAPRNMIHQPTVCVALLRFFLYLSSSDSLWLIHASHPYSSSQISPSISNRAYTSAFAFFNLNLDFQVNFPIRVESGNVSPDLKHPNPISDKLISETALNSPSRYF